MDNIKTLIVIDDMVEVLELFTFAVEKDPLISLSTFKHAQLALDALKIANYDVIITDMNLGSGPVINGLDLISELIELEYPGKIILMTGYGGGVDSTLITDEIKQRIDLFVKKPFSMTDILAWIHNNVFPGAVL